MSASRRSADFDETTALLSLNLKEERDLPENGLSTPKCRPRTLLASQLSTSTCSAQWLTIKWLGSADKRAALADPYLDSLSLDGRAATEIGPLFNLAGSLLSRPT
jgi:hypothetical protein